MEKYQLTSSSVEQLKYIPKRDMVAETFGWQPGIWGALFIATACVFVPHGDKSLHDALWLIFGPSALLGLVLIGYEIWRRRNRTVLVKNGESISVFRKGLLDLTLAPIEITRIKTDFHTTLMIGVPLGVCTVLFAAIGIANILRNEVQSNDNMLILFLGLVCGASLASAAWTNFFCSHLRVPIKGSKWKEESVLVKSSRLKELFM
jgi:hypothetical protein